MPCLDRPAVTPAQSWTSQQRRQRLRHNKTSTKGIRNSNTFADIDKEAKRTSEQPTRHMRYDHTPETMKTHRNGRHAKSPPQKKTQHRISHPLYNPAPPNLARAEFSDSRAGSIHDRGGSRVRHQLLLGNRDLQLRRLRRRSAQHPGDEVVHLVLLHCCHGGHAGNAAVRWHVSVRDLDVEGRRKGGPVADRELRVTRLVLVVGWGCELWVKAWSRECQASLWFR